LKRPLRYLDKLLKQLPALMQVSSSAPLDRRGCTLPALTKSPRSELNKKSYEINSAQLCSANEALQSRQPLYFYYGWCTGLCSRTLKRTAMSRILEQIAMVEAREWTLETAPSSSAYLA
jgi:hypothetical protein